jgi:hypothetical protein
MTDNSLSLYQKIILVTEEYLGPSAQRFVDKQIISHLSKPPEEISAEDIPKLVQWCNAVFSVLTEDRSVIQEYVSRIEALGK